MSDRVLPIWKYGPVNTIWSSDKNKCLVVCPYASYDVYRALIKPHISGPEIGESGDIFLHRDGLWGYCGTYECTGTAREYFSDIKSLVPYRVSRAYFSILEPARMLS